MQDYDISVALQVFNAPIPWSCSAEEESCQNEIIDKLSESELEQAACTSYAYFAKRENNGVHRRKMALRMARRCLVADKGNVQKALNRLRNTLKFREEVRINDLRAVTCQDPDISNEWTESLAVSGYDTSNRAILVRFARKFDFSTLTLEVFIKIVLYQLERAIACGEYRSRGTQEKIVVATDYSNHERAASPSTAFMRAVIDVFQIHYPERLELFIGVDPPLSVRLVTSIIWPFLDPETRKKIKSVSGDQAKQTELKSIVSLDQAMSFLRPGGQVKTWDTKKYLNSIPFHLAAHQAF